MGAHGGELPNSSPPAATSSMQQLLETGWPPRVIDIRLAQWPASGFTIDYRLALAHPVSSSE